MNYSFHLCLSSKLLQLLQIYISDQFWQVLKCKRSFQKTGEKRNYLLNNYSPGQALYFLREVHSDLKDRLTCTVEVLFNIYN